MTGRTPSIQTDVHCVHSREASQFRELGSSGEELHTGLGAYTVSIEGLDRCTETVSDGVVTVCGLSGLLRRMPARNGQQALPILSILGFKGSISAGGSVSGILFFSE